MRKMTFDIMKWATVLVVIHLLWFFVAPGVNTLFAPQFVGMFFFLISGLMAYWLLVDPYRNMIYPKENDAESVKLPACETPEKEMRPVGVPDDF